MPNPATPDQQAQYDAFVKNGMRLVYTHDKPGLKKLLTSLDGGGDPVAGLANTLAAVSMRLVGSAKKAGSMLAPEVILHGSGELLEQLADFSKQTGGHAYSDDELRSIAQGMADGYQQKAQGGAPPSGGAPPQAPAAGPPSGPPSAPQPAAPPQLMP